MSASHLFTSYLCCVFPLEYFLYAFCTGQQFYKLVSQFFLAIYVFREKIAIKLNEFRAGCLLAKCPKVCNQFCFDFFSRYGIWAPELCCCWLLKQRKKVERMGVTNLHSSCMHVLTGHRQDRGFTIAEDLLLRHAKLHIPTGKRGQEQFSKSEV